MPTTQTSPQEDYAKAVDLLAQRQDEHLAAETAVDELRSRLRSGDDKVTAAMLGKADAEVERTGLLSIAAIAQVAVILAARGAGPEAQVASVARLLVRLSPERASLCHRWS